MKHDSYLVQRLDQLTGREPNPFAFGGGIRNGGLSDEAVGLLKDIFAFDYMGAAEFEYGAIPTALRGIAKQAANGTMSAAVFELDEIPVYLLADTNDIAEAEQRVRTWTFGYGKGRPHMKESPMLDRAIERIRAGFPPGHRDDTGPNKKRPVHYSRTIGWLELDNGWFAFVDRDAWEQTCALFGIPLPATSKETADA